LKWNLGYSNQKKKFLILVINNPKKDLVIKSFNLVFFQKKKMVAFVAKILH